MLSTHRPLCGKTALITHALLSPTSYLIAQKLAEQGCALILTDFLDKESAKPWLKVFEDSAERVDYCPEKNKHQPRNSMEFFKFSNFSNALLCYETNPAYIENRMEWNSINFPDIVVHDALAGLQAELLELLNDLPMQYAEWTTIVHKILDPAAFMYEAFGQAMQQRGWGRFITIAPPQTLLESPYQLAFTTALAGLVGASKVQARAYSRVPITCNLIHPGLIDNEYMQQYIAHYAQAEGKTVAAKTQELLEQKTLSQQFTSPEQVAETVLFLCSEDANDIHANVWKLNQ